MAVKWNFRCACWGFISSLLASVLLTYCFSPQSHLAFRVIAGAAAVLIGISSLIAFHISTLRCSESHTLITLLMSYKWHQGERLATPSTLARATYMWKRPREAQEDLIRELTRRHAKTEYGRKNRLGEIRSVEDLRKKHPLTTYDHYCDYIQRLADGEEGVFLDEEPMRFGVTSGTTGAGKKIPLVSFGVEGDALCSQIKRLALYQGAQRPSPVQKRCFFYIHPKISLTKTGRVISPYTFIKQEDTKRLSELSSPPPAFTITNEPSAVYIHMLFAIADTNLALLSTMFTPQMYRALKCLEAKWQVMLEDLSTGQINAKIPLDPDTRRSLQGYLRPDKARVSQLRSEFEKGFHGILKRIWPHLIAIEAIDIAGFKKKIEETYTDGVPYFNWAYGSTEVGQLAINMWLHDKEVRYALCPHMAVVEFIPEQNSSDEDPKTLLIDEVEVGGRYELVLTTRSGLYRYRNGDVIQIVGFHENCPAMRMLYRSGEYLNLVYEKVNTQVVDAAIKNTIQGWPGIQLVDWTCAESPVYDPESSELYYIAFLEVDPGKRELNDVTAEQRSKFDEHLQQDHVYYSGLRESNTISPSRVKFVRPGTFLELRDFRVNKTTASVMMYKTPRKLRTREHVIWMMERVIETK
ncbi:probable indole-3-acetic acid-amido synthetase GH3.9 [Patiria miniata]|uniref:GH3 domain-containing protein n=1 Tax=Patiria miniata TaxID=46514 RepID=A0A913Z6N9_PATMI|nr:probable indole-3-acetic acid-amido synthetase GH3.9 [Patiria miniata]